MVAGRAFNQVGYPPEKYHFEIADIIGDHDTKRLSTTDSGRIMRIADMLWRVTYPMVQIYLPNSSPQQVFERMKNVCLESEAEHLGEVGLKIARLECVNAMSFKFGEIARRVFPPDYKPEFERIESLANSS